MWTYQCTIAQQILVNEVKLCTLKIQHDVQLAMAKFAGQSKIVSLRPLLMILQ